MTKDTGPSVPTEWTTESTRHLQLKVKDRESVTGLYIGTSRLLSVYPTRLNTREGRGWGVSTDRLESDPTSPGTTRRGGTRQRHVSPTVGGGDVDVLVETDLGAPLGRTDGVRLAPRVVAVPRVRQDDAAPDPVGPVTVSTPTCLTGTYFGV